LIIYNLYLIMDIKLLKKYIEDNIFSYAINFDIPEEFLESDAEIINLILKSKALDTDEDKQNWLNLLSVMNEEQVYKLKEILIKEKKKLDEIEEKYAEKKRQIRQKYLLRWQKIWYIEKIKDIKEKEESFHSEEEKSAEKLLDEL